ncbi:hypothetical protein L596_010621 [Steinernema carpocapsae]|uniref:Uncharacterized protein n=1 Tax=Steinernema carpocapsae TaxID=34508 RepID=A0A4U5PJH6_STECR|nr:hypothetical protein L596_010621 [Steinernema carpocapsae]
MKDDMLQILINDHNFLKGQIANKDIEMADLKTQLRITKVTLTKTEEALNDEIKQRQVDLDEVNKEDEKIQQRFDDFQLKNETLKNQLQEAKTKYDALKKELDELKAKIKRLKTLKTM